MKRKEFGKEEARPLVIVSSAIGCVVGVWQNVDDKMVALAFLIGIAVAAIFLMGSHQRSKASK